MNGKMQTDALDRLSALLPPGIACRVLGLGDGDVLAVLRQTVIDHQLADPNCYRLTAESPDFPASHLGNTDGCSSDPERKGSIAGLFDIRGDLVAYGALTLPRPGESSRCDSLDLPADERHLTAYLASAMVRADWRGFGLHHALIEWRLALASALGRRHMVSATWPGNYRSWGHLTAHGVHGKKLVMIADGVWRLLVHRDLESHPPQADPSTTLLIPLSKLAHRKELFDAGFWLWRLVRQPEGLFAELAHPLALVKRNNPPVKPGAYLTEL